MFVYFKINNWVVRHKKYAGSDAGSGSGGIRTHIPAETGALIQRLTPLGHATWAYRFSYYCPLNFCRWWMALAGLRSRPLVTSKTSNKFQTEEYMSTGAGKELKRQPFPLISKAHFFPSSVLRWCYVHSVGRDVPCRYSLQSGWKEQQQKEQTI